MKKQIIGSILIFTAIIASFTNPPTPGADKYFIIGQEAAYLIILILGVWLIIKGKKERKG